MNVLVKEAVLVYGFRAEADIVMAFAAGPGFVYAGQHGIPFRDAGLYSHGITSHKWNCVKCSGQICKIPEKIHLLILDILSAYFHYFRPINVNHTT